MTFIGCFPFNLLFSQCDHKDNMRQHASNQYHVLGDSQQRTSEQNIAWK